MRVAGTWRLTVSALQCKQWLTLCALVATGLPSGVLLTSRHVTTRRNTSANHASLLPGRSVTFAYKARRCRPASPARFGPGLLSAHARKECSHETCPTGGERAARGGRTAHTHCCW